MREPALWGHTALTEAADVLHIPELNTTLTLAEIYEETGVMPMQIEPSAMPSEGQETG